MNDLPWLNFENCTYLPTERFVLIDGLGHVIGFRTMERMEDYMRAQRRDANQRMENAHCFVSDGTSWQEIWISDHVLPKGERLDPADDGDKSPAGG